MRKSLEQLIEISQDVRTFLNVASFEIHIYEDGSFTEFHVQKVKDVAELVRVANFLHVSLYHDDTYIIVHIDEEYQD